MAARLSIIVPTHDGEGLDNLFLSLNYQLNDDDEVVVIGDTHDEALPEVQSQVQKAGFRYLKYDAGHHCYGHCQVNHGISNATGDYLVFIDDDDCFTESAFEAIRRASAEQSIPCVLMFKFWSKRHGMALPVTHEVKESAIGGHCIVAPNIPDRLGKWECRYAGDYDFIVSTLAFYPEGPVWYDDVIACA